MKKLYLLIALVFTSLFTLGLAVPPAANAAATQCGPGGCELFQYGPGNGDLISATGGTLVRMMCWTDVSWFSDGTNRWFKVSDIYGTGTNWVNANQVKFQTTVGHC